MRNIAKQSLDRRHFLRLATAGAITAGTGLTLLLEACGLVPSSLGGGARPAGAGATGPNTPYPTYIPSSTPAKPDFHSTDPRYEDGYNSYPTPFTSWTRDPPATGARSTHSSEFTTRLRLRVTRIQRTRKWSVS